MFTKTARYYDALYHFKDYHAASERLHQVIQQIHPGASSLLDVACGTGKHLEHLQKYYQVAGLDLDAELLAIASQRCPNIPLYHDDMSTFDLCQSFDVIVCLFRSIGYVKTIDKLYSTVSRCRAHLNQGGVVLIEPWFTPEEYWSGHFVANYADFPDLKIAWMYVQQEHDGVAVLDIKYQVGSPDGVTQFSELHELGLFTDEQYRMAFAAAGLAVRYERQGPMADAMYIGVVDS